MFYRYIFQLHILKYLLHEPLPAPPQMAPQGICPQYPSIFVISRKGVIQSRLLVGICVVH